MSETEQRKSVLFWRKSSYSIANGQCVAVAAVPGAVQIRDTARPAGDRLRISAGAWREFVAQVKGA